MSKLFWGLVALSPTAYITLCMMMEGSLSSLVMFSTSVACALGGALIGSFIEEIYNRHTNG